MNRIHFIQGGQVGLTDVSVKMQQEKGVYHVLILRNMVPGRRASVAEVE